MIIPLDNKASAQESLTVLQQAIDRGLRLVAQGQGSGAALAILEAVNRHNERNPGKEILYLNYAAIDPKDRNFLRVPAAKCARLGRVSGRRALLLGRIAPRRSCAPGTGRYGK